MKEPKLVYLEWEDAATLDDKWSDLKEVDEWVKDDVAFCKNVGWILRETKTCIIIASMQAPKNAYQDQFWSHIHKIPKTWIKKRKELKV